MSAREIDFYARALKLGSRIQGYAGLRVNAALADLQLAQLESELKGTTRVVWSSPLVPSELLAAFGLASVTPETVSAILSSTGQGGKLLECAEAGHLSGDCCSFQRGAVGALELGYTPVPEAFISTAPICDDNPKMADFLSQKYGRNYFLLDLPAGDDQDAQEYVVAQLGDLTTFLEELTGDRADPERLRQTVTESNHARRFWAEANRLRREQPPVIYGVAALRMAGGLLLQKLGLPGLTEALAAYAGEIAERIEARAFLPARHRLLWLHLFPLYDRGFMRFIEVDLGAVVVFEESSFIWWEEIDPRDPLPGLAKRMLACPLTGLVSRRVSAIREMVRDYRIDGVVNFSHQGCRALTGGAPFIAAALRENGIPFLDLSGDCLDNRSPSTASWRARIEAFVEMLGS